ncbi:MAG: hypothetical protein ACRELG_05575, partial [Gemmataceae bacterium]
QGAILLWEAASGKSLGQWKGQQSCCRAIAFSPDAKWAASVDDKSIVHLWDRASGRERRRFQAAKSSCAVAALAFSADGAIVAANCGDALVFCNTKTGRTWRTAARCNPTLAFSPDGKLVAAVQNHVICLLDVSSGKEVRKLGRRRDDLDGVCLAFSPDGKLLATGEKSIQLWRVADGAEVRPLRGVAPAIDSAVFTPDGRFLTTAAADGFIRLWNASLGAEVRCFKARVPDNASLAFSRDGKLLFLPKGKQLSLPGRGIILAVSAEDRIAARRGENYIPHIHFEELASGHEIACTDLDAEMAFIMGSFPRPVHAAVFSPDGRTLATATEYEPIRLWETATGKERYRLARQRGQIEQLAFAPDGNKLVSVSTEKNAVVWRVFGPRPDQRPAALSAEQLRSLWTDLASADGRVAFRAGRALSAADPAVVVAFLRRQEKDIPRLDRPRVARWIAELDSEEFAVREKTVAELEKLGVLAEKLMRKALQDRPTLEMRKRVEMLLDKLKDKPTVPA